MHDPRAKPRFNLQWSGIALWTHFLILLLNQVTLILGLAPYVNRGLVRFSELQSLNASCFPRDSCFQNKKKDDIYSNNNCLCGKTCATYDACCLDSPYRFLLPNGRHISRCIHVEGTSMDVYMVTKCRPDYAGDPHISELCSGDAKKLNDIMLLIPVTNSKTGLTYKNYFCAVCHDDVTIIHNVFWPVKLISYRKEISQSELPNLRFDSTSTSWLLPNQDNSTDSIQQQIYLQLQLPSDKEHIKRCFPEDILTSGCPVDWVDDVTRRKCADYMALIVSLSEEEYATRFRNIHCLICNNFTSAGALRCNIGSFNTYYGGYNPGSLSFALMLDVNWSDGHKVGEVQRCPKNKIYDPFSKRCRALSCALPGYSIRNGRCVKQ